MAWQFQFEDYNSGDNYNRRAAIIDTWLNKGQQKFYVLDLCHLPHLTIWGLNMKTPHASSGILEIN